MERYVEQHSRVIVAGGAQEIKIKLTEQNAHLLEELGRR